MGVADECVRLKLGRWVEGTLSTEVIQNSGSGVVLPVAKGMVYDLPCPSNLRIWWNMGSLLRLCLVGQVVTGWLLTFYYTPHEEMAFERVSFIIKEVEMGWAFRRFHINVANFMFACLYIHVGRGLYYGSFRLYGVWARGVVLLLLVILTAFTGYVLP